MLPRVAPPRSRCFVQCAADHCVAVALPPGRVIDGYDMSPILFQGGPSRHECVYIYKVGQAF
jgi:hypothetical protein